MMTILLFLMLGTLIFAIPVSSVFGTVAAGFLLFEALSAVALGVVVVDWFRNRRKLLVTPVFAALLLWFGFLVVSALLGNDRSVSFLGFLHRQNGLLDLVFLLPFFLLARQLLVSGALSRAALRFLLVAGILESLFVLWQLAPLQQEIVAGYGGRPFGTFGNPDLLAIALLVFFFFAALVAFDSREHVNWRLAAVLALPLVSISLIFVNSRGALLGLFAGLVVFLFLSQKVLVAKQHRFAVAISALVLLVFVAVTLGALFIYNNQLWGHFFSRDSIETRLMLWKTSVTLFAERPFFGWGHGNFLLAFDAVDAAALSGNAAREPGRFDSAHNIFVEQAVEGGILGFAGFISLFIAAAYTVLRLRKRAFIPSHISVAMLALLASLVVALLVLFHQAGTWVLFFFVLAFIDALWLRAKGQRAVLAPRFTPRSIAGYAGGIALMIVVASFVWQYTFAATTLVRMAEERRRPDERARLLLGAVAASGPVAAPVALASAESAYNTLLDNPLAFDRPETHELSILLEHNAQVELSRVETARTWFILGRSLMARAWFEDGLKQRLGEAERAFERALSLSPGRATVLWSIAETKVARQQWQESEILYRGVTEANPALGEGHARLALFYSAQIVTEASSSAEQLRLRAFESFEKAYARGFHFNNFTNPLWFADPFALNNRWQESAEFWQETATLCELVVGENNTEEECILFVSHATVAAEKYE